MYPGTETLRAIGEEEEEEVEEEEVEKNVTNVINEYKGGR